MSDNIKNYEDLQIKLQKVMQECTKLREENARLKALLDLQNTISFEITDERFEGKPIDVTFNGELSDLQFSAGLALSPFDNGILSATTAFGKTKQWGTISNKKTLLATRYKLGCFSRILNGT